jgi:putative acetyltransferase
VDSRIQIEDPQQPEVLALLADNDSYMRSCVRQSIHLLDASALATPEVTFLVVRVSGRAVGFAAVVRRDATFGEIKRMFIAPDMRGQKLGRLLLNALEDCARANGLSCLQLETGTRQPEATALYRSAGYYAISPFRNYKPDPLSLFMEKKLT